MRLLIDTLIALMLAGILGAVVLDHRQDRHQLDRVAAVQQAVRAIQSQSLWRAAMGETPKMPNGYSRRIDAAWFDHVPRNVLVESEGLAYQWLDYSPDRGGSNEWFDPPCIVAAVGHAAFWYNPHRGIVRARVPMQFTQQDTVDLYNLVNGTNLRVADCRWDFKQVEPGAAAADGAGLTAGAAPVDDVVQALSAGKR